MHKHIITVLRQKTAKAIIERCHKADKSSAISADGFSVHGNAVNATAIKTRSKLVSYEYCITINSSVFPVATLEKFVSDAFASLNTHKLNK